MRKDSYSIGHYCCWCKFIIPHPTTIVNVFCSKMKEKYKIQFETIKRTIYGFSKNRQLYKYSYATP